MDDERAHGKRALRVSWRGVLVFASTVGFLTLLLVGILLVVLRSAHQVGGETQRVFDEMHAAMARVRLPPGYTLVHVDRGGSIGIFQDQAPYEERVYAVDHAPSTTDPLRAALEAAGFTAERPFECSFSAQRGRVDIFVVYDRTPQPPAVDHGQHCPSPTWPHVYAWTLLSEAQHPQQPTATKAIGSP
jgi:hypothetical protein